MAYRLRPPTPYDELRVNAVNPCNTMPQAPLLPLQLFNVPPPPLPPSLSPLLQSPVTYLPQTQYYNIPNQFSNIPLATSVQGFSANYSFDPVINHLDRPSLGNYQKIPCSWPQNTAGVCTETIQKSEDERWIKDWFSRRKQSLSDCKKTSSTLKVFQAKEHLQTCVTLLHQLKTAQEQLAAECKDLNRSSWESKMEAVQQKANEVEACMSEFKNSGTLEDLQKTLVKRSKKRKSEKRRRLECREIVDESYARRQQLHRSIDTWLEDMQGAVEKAKTEESLKKEADAILSDVTRKKVEARRQVALLSALLKLRQLRVKSAASKGQHIPAEHGSRFTKVTEHLKELWEKQLKEYNLEEQGLRVMLSVAVDERDQTRVLREKRNLIQWEQLLFGERQPNIPDFYMAAENDVEAFVSIRRSWDKFIASAEAPMSSAIPVGWVLPTIPSSSQWEAVLSSAQAVD